MQHTLTSKEHDNKRWSHGMKLPTTDPRFALIWTPLVLPDIVRGTNPLERITLRLGVLVGERLWRKVQICLGWLSAHALLVPQVYSMVVYPRTCTSNVYGLSILFNRRRISYLVGKDVVSITKHMATENWLLQRQTSESDCNNYYFQHAHQEQVKYLTSYISVASANILPTETHCRKTGYGWHANSPSFLIWDQTFNTARQER